MANTQSKVAEDINVTGDYRAIYYAHGNTCIFIRIGTHPQLYG